MGLDPKGIAQAILFGRWRRPLPLEDGYAILLPTPMDMPFLLRFSLEGLRSIDTRHCRQVLVVPDGFGDDGGEGLRTVVEQFGDPRVEVADLSRGLNLFVHRLQKRKSHRTAANWSHWAMIVEGTSRARCEHVFMHDADAFFVEADGLERQYRECRDRGLYALGVQARSDPFFERLGYEIPATWELMYSVRWARKRPPISLKGRWRDSPDGTHEFDTMLYPEYLDYASGRIGVMAGPPELVHFNGAVTTYRVLKDRRGRPVVDELFRLLLLSMLEDLVPAPDGHRNLPPSDLLARGLTDPEAPVTYGSDWAVREYPIFRGQVDRMCASPPFEGARAGRLREMIRPFDEHFADRTVAPPAGEAPIRRDCLG